jgi:hypothetical protein
LYYNIVKKKHKKISRLAANKKCPQHPYIFQKDFNGEVVATHKKNGGIRQVSR